ncbi:beta-galactosidase [Paenibacillus eucommiae]|uniref:Glycoside hydrolase family 42 N-terminal domain-containing protein n=1 Tax=Paenibacillus eucommiae TaxID=1355755 RepID=A0ABS4J1M3_9BACL|nr:beta-galactosidase [Paenibacillus eucommiae]MBP1993690.1 hypothetical protein [Paenibacillus eucommiae]
MSESTQKLLIKQEGIPIGLFVPPPNHEITTERYREIKDAGFTFVLGLTEYDGGTAHIHRALAAAHDNGLQYLVCDPRLVALPANELDKVGPYVTEFSSHPAYAGHLFMDEPNIAQFGKLRDLKAVYQEAAPQGLAYVNLFPTYASNEQLGGEYDEYVRLFMEQFKPDILSYDHYPFIDLRPDRELTITKDYYENLGIIREAVLRSKVPFWLFIQTLSYNEWSRDPLEAEIRWQVYTSLAFGAKGIQYFTYWTPEDGNETFCPGMIDRSGNKTRHYDEVQTLNREIAPLGEVLIHLTSIGVLSHGKVSPPIEGGLTEFAPILRIEGDPAVIGCFHDADDNAYALVVNESFQESCSLNIWLRKSEEPVSVWENGQKTVLHPEQGSLALELRPGEGKLVSFS